MSPKRGSILLRDCKCFIGKKKKRVALQPKVHVKQVLGTYYCALLPSRATTADLYFPQVVLCNSNFIQATFLQEFNITQHANLLIRYFYSGSAKDITEKETKIIGEIEVGG